MNGTAGASLPDVQRWQIHDPWCRPCYQRAPCRSAGNSSAPASLQQTGACTLVALIFSVCCCLPLYVFTCPSSSNVPLLPCEPDLLLVNLTRCPRVCYGHLSGMCPYGTYSCVCLTIAMCPVRFKSELKTMIVRCIRFMEIDAGDACDVYNRHVAQTG